MFVDDKNRKVITCEKYVIEIGTCKLPLSSFASVDCSFNFPFEIGSPSGNNINVSRLITVFPLIPFVFD